MAQTFNFSYAPEKDEIAHASLNTVLLTPDGKFAKSYLRQRLEARLVLRDIRGLLPR